VTTEHFLDAASPPTTVAGAQSVMDLYNASGWAPYVGGTGAYQPAVKNWNEVLPEYEKAFDALLPIYVCRRDNYGTADDSQDAIACFNKLPRNTVCLDLEPIDRSGGYQGYINRMITTLKAYGHRVVLYSWTDVIVKCSLIPNPPDAIWAAAPGKNIDDLPVGNLWPHPGQRAVQTAQVGNGRYDLSVTDDLWIANMGGTMADATLSPTTIAAIAVASATQTWNRFTHNGRTYGQILGDIYDDCQSLVGHAGGGGTGGTVTDLSDAALAQIATAVNNELAKRLVS